MENAHDVGKYRKFRPECANICKNVKKTGNFVTTYKMWEVVESDWLKNLTNVKNFKKCVEKTLKYWKMWGKAPKSRNSGPIRDTKKLSIVKREKPRIR